MNAEKMINAMFVGLDEDVTLKTVMEVMYGLKPESVLDELKNVNEENIKEIVERMELSEATMNTEGKVVMHDASGNILDLPMNVEKVTDEKSGENVNGNNPSG